jgi:SAM-dependent methyltransferase
MSTIKSKIISLLKKSPADQYSIYRQIGEYRMSDITKTLADLLHNKIIEVIYHRKNKRTGFKIPIYSLSSKTNRTNRLDIDDLIAGMSAERTVEYEFLANNIPSAKTQATILDVGTDESQIIKKLHEYGGIKWHTYCIDISDIKEKSLSKYFSRMDGREMAFRQGIFDLVICISAIEHVGIPSKLYNIKKIDREGDKRLMSEINHVLKQNGKVILSLPYGNKFNRSEYRIYNRSSLDDLISDFSVIKKEFYLFEKGGWKKCKRQSIADEYSPIEIPLHFHSPILSCLCLKKKARSSF